MVCWVSILLIMYFLFDVNYFLRIFFTLAWGRLFQKKKKLFDTTSIYGICTTQDIDLFLKHMNNARYLRELDFARFHYYDLSGIYGELMRHGAGVVQGASFTRYRRALGILTPYKITTKLIYWEGKNFYVEHEFISLTDNFIRAVALSKQTVTGLKIPVSEIIANIDPTAQRPEINPDLRLWMESMEESSKKLKKQN
ncbi:protein THEM6 [Fopius arisanus]|uniref:Protein THEM6 n=2 Tax=Fopius arisanus TaxID=64838 RepID=A0A9R1UAQ9_9HYME|nr:PREDICTED: protein THEM6 [Fopius arisanus]